MEEDKGEVVKLMDMDSSTEAMSQDTETASEDDKLISAEAMLDSLMESISRDMEDESKESDANGEMVEDKREMSEENSETVVEKKEEGVKYEQNSEGDEKREKVVEGATTPSSTSEASRKPFSANEKMKKGLSMLAFPTKGSHSRPASRNKGTNLPRTISNYRITIGEALEKAQDIRNSMGLSACSKDMDNGIKTDKKDVSEDNSDAIINSLMSRSVEIKKMGEKDSLTGTVSSPHPSTASPIPCPSTASHTINSTDLAPIRWKKLPSSVNAVNKMSGARVLAVGYSGDAQAQGNATGKPDDPRLPKTAFEPPLSETSKPTPSNLQQTWQESVGVTKNPWNVKKPYKPKVPFALASTSHDKSDSVVYLKMDSGEEKAIKPKQCEKEEKRRETDTVSNSGNPAETGNSAVPNPALVEEKDSDSTELNSLSVITKEIKVEDDVMEVEPIPQTSAVTSQTPAVTPQIQAVSSQVPTVTPHTSVMSRGTHKKGVGELHPERKHKSAFGLPINKKVQYIDKPFRVPDVQKKFQPIFPKSKMQGIKSDSFNKSSGKYMNHTRPAALSERNIGTDQGQGIRVPIVKPTAGNINTPELRRPLALREHKTFGPCFVTNKPSPDSHKYMESRWDEMIHIGFRCPNCQKIFLTEWQMIKHSLSHLKFQCDICDQTFSSEIDFKEHLHNHLTINYEDEKYYTHFSCKKCHSLKCECIEETYSKPKEMPKVYSRPQKARRSSKIFHTKPNSGPNDHLRVTLGNYKKSLGLQKSGTNVAKGTVQHLKNPQQNIMVKNIHHPVQKSKNTDTSQIKGTGLPNTQDSEPYRNPHISNQEPPQAPKMTIEQRISVRSDLVEQSEMPPVVNPPAVVKVERRGRPPGSRKRSTKLSSNFIYKDTDFYFMCEMCDASFLSKAELSEHMFFHRLKSRSRRGEKRRLAESMQEEETSQKKLKEDEPPNMEEVVTINVGGFERFKCPMCKGHFASITDLSRHKTQAHKGGEMEITISESIPAPSPEMLKCNFCNRLYRRERELRRHLKHDCVAIPSELRNKISVGINLTVLQEQGEAEFYTLVQKPPEEIVMNEYGTKVAPQKGPITCKYCLMVTRREAEMKRHVWKHCPKIPKTVIKQFKDGATLEELGFIYSDIRENSSDIHSSPPMLDQEPAKDDPDWPGPVIPAMPVMNPVFVHPMKPRSKEPLVCTYCGIWYFREVALMKHMRERCITISSQDRELLERGAGLCTFSPEAPPKTCGPTEQKGIFKMVDRNSVPHFHRHLGPPVQVKIEVDDEEQGQSSIPPEASHSIMQEERMLPWRTKTTLPNEHQVLENAELLQAVKVEPEELPTPAGLPVGEVAVKKPGIKVHRCKRCHETFSTPEAVLAHSSVHHGPKKGFYKCKLCLVKIAKYKQLREHVWEHTNETPYKCHICEMKFRQSDVITKHLRDEHNFHMINERNLYRWLPGRNGKYREIKDKNAEEESLGDIDTSLDNVAELMVVSDNMWDGDNSLQKPETCDNEMPEAERCSSVESSPVGQNSFTTSAILNCDKLSISGGVNSEVRVCSVLPAPLSQSPNCATQANCNETIDTTKSKNVVEENENVRHSDPDGRFMRKVEGICSIENKDNKQTELTNVKSQDATDKESTDGYTLLKMIERMETQTSSSISISKGAKATTAPQSNTKPSNAKLTNVMGEQRIPSENGEILKKRQTSESDEVGEMFLCCDENLESIIETVELNDNFLK